MSRFLVLARKHSVISVSLVLVVTLLVLILVGAAESWEDGRIKAIRASGQPVTLAELDASYALPPGASNAASVYAAAFLHPIISLSNSGPALLEGEWAAERGKLLSDAQMAEVESILIENRETIKLLHSVPPGTPSRYPMDLTQGFNTLLPHLAKIKRAVTLLCVEAQYHSARGDNESAIKSVRAAATLADSVRDEPTLISHLVWIACRSITLGVIERLPQASKWNDSQLRALQQLAASSEYWPGLSHALAAERSFGLAVFTDRQQQAMALGGGPTGTAGPSGFKTAVIIGALKTTGLLRRDRAFYLDTMAHIIAQANNAFPANFAKVDRSLTNTVPNKLYIISRMMLPALSKTFQRDGELASRARAAQILLATERYRLDKGALPQSLDDLVPAYLASVPLDPFSGESMRYAQREGGGYVVYSVGSDQKDDGGPAENKKQPPNRDVGVVVVR